MKLGRISSHARLRMKRQGMSEAALAGLLANGRVEPDGLGGQIVHFESAPRGRHAYAVLDGAGEVITIGSRHRCRVGNAAWTKGERHGNDDAEHTL